MQFIEEKYKGWLLIMMLKLEREKKNSSIHKKRERNKALAYTLWMKNFIFLLIKKENKDKNKVYIQKECEFRFSLRLATTYVQYINTHNTVQKWIGLVRYSSVLTLEILRLFFYYLFLYLD